MAKIVRNLLILIAAFIISASAMAQSTGSVTGSVLSSDNKPVEAASMSLLKANDSSVVKIAVSDKAGNYSFENIKPGSYLVQAEAVGYNKYMSTAVDITAAKKQALVDACRLTTADKTLGAVSVSATRPLIENKIDKTVVNVDASPTNSGLSALEVLEKSPGVTVDNDGNISLKGKAGVTVMIDGKLTYMNATDLANYLKSMSANEIDQIEIMSQPPAKYDAAGNSGIINIKTKKNKANGFNASITSSGILAIYFKQTNTINVNWRKNKINVYASYGYSHWEGFNKQTLDREFRNSVNTPFNSYVNQSTYGRYTDFNTTYKAGIDFFASKNTTISAVVNGFVDNSYFKSTSTANFYDSLHHFTQVNDAISDNINPWKNIGVDVNLQHKLDDKGGEIDLDAGYISYKSNSPQYSDNYLYDPTGALINDPTDPNPYLLNGYLPSNINIYTFKADYTKELANKIQLEAGIKTSYVRSDNNAEYTLFDSATKKWDVDTGRSNHFLYTENINAAYLSLQKEIKKFTVKLGLRGEQTVSTGNLITKDSVFRLNYVKLFPSSYISYQVNDDNTLAISYGRRIERPDYQDLNPFEFQIDRYTYQQGNPRLQPQFSQNFELSYNYKGVWNISANYTATNNIINDVIITTQDAEKNYVSYQTKQNIASNKNIGLAANFSKQFKKWWSLNVFGNVFNNAYKGNIAGENINVSQFSFSGNFSNRFTFNKGWSSEISGFFQGENLVSSAILARPMGMFSLGAGKQILKGNGTIRLSLRDPFYLMRFNGETVMDDFVLHIHSQWDNRRAILTFTYRFGKNNNQQQAKKSSAADDEQNRVKAGGGQQ